MSEDRNILYPKVTDILPDIKNSFNNYIAETNTNFNVVHAELARSAEERYNREEENRENLRRAAENTGLTNDKLDKQIQQMDEDLQNQRELINMLKQQLTGINRALNDLFILEENNQEILQDANTLARELCADLIQKKKIDWKSLVADKGFDVVLATIPFLVDLVSKIQI